MVDEAREEGGVEEAPVEETPSWGGEAPAPADTVHIETGRGQTAEVPVGAPFQETVERIADEAHYGGYFRVFLNGDEILDPSEAPEKVEAGMRIAVTSYDKVG